jgi:site-specific recombinase XerD
MTRQKQNTLLALVQSYFQDYLRGVRGASEHTIRAYRDTLRLFFSFILRSASRSAADLTLSDIRVESVLAFLSHIESARGNSPATRNCRLAAIRSFAQHLLRHDLMYAEQYARILATPRKRSTSQTVPYLEPNEARAIIEAVNPNSPNGSRDRALLLFLYNTGARVSEALSVRPRELQLHRPRQVRLHGKGGKERLCPLWPETASALRQILEGVPAEGMVFRSASGSPLTRDGVAYLLDKYVQRASESLPELRSRRITPHVFRHSCAVALLQAGMDLTVIRDYLGHATVATTNRYVTINLKMKRDALNAFWKRSGLEKTATQRWKPPLELLAFLETL